MVFLFRYRYRCRCRSWPLLLWMIFYILILCGWFGMSNLHGGGVMAKQSTSQTPSSRLPVAVFDMTTQMTLQNDNDNNSRSIRCWKKQNKKRKKKNRSNLHPTEEGPFLSTHIHRKKSPCQRCPAVQTKGSDDDHDHVLSSSSFHRALLFIPYPLSETWISLIVGLLLSNKKNSQFHLTIVLVMRRRGEESSIDNDDVITRFRHAILSGIPCHHDDDGNLPSRLKIWMIQSDSPNVSPSHHQHQYDDHVYTKNPWDVFHTCSLSFDDDANSTMDFLFSEPSTTPHVILTDASWMESFWIIEKQQRLLQHWKDKENNNNIIIPVVAIVSDPSCTSLLPILVEHHPSWIPSYSYSSTSSKMPSFMAYTWTLLTQRWQSMFQLTSFFMTSNRRRKQQYHLPLYRHPFEHIESAVIVLAEYGHLPIPIMNDDGYDDDNNRHHYTIDDKDYYHDDDEPIWREPQQRQKKEGKESSQRWQQSSQSSRGRIGRTTNTCWENFCVTGPMLPPCIPCQGEEEDEDHDIDDSSVRRTENTFSTPAASSFAETSLKTMRRRLWKDPSSESSLTGAAAATTTTSSTTTRTSVATILIVPPMDPTPVTIRTLLQGLSLARTSLTSYDDCHWSPSTCQKYWKNFHIQWLSSSTDNSRSNKIGNDNGSNHDDDDFGSHHSFLPPVTLQGFSQEDSLTLMDAIIRHYDINDDVDDTTNDSILQRLRSSLLVMLPCQERNLRILSDVFHTPVLCYYDDLHHDYHAATTTDRTNSIDHDDERVAYVALKSETTPREIAGPILKWLRSLPQQQDHVQKKKDEIKRRSHTSESPKKTDDDSDDDMEDDVFEPGTTSVDGLTLAVSIIHQIAKLHQEREIPWTSPIEMRRTMLRAIRKSGHFFMNDEDDDIMIPVSVVPYNPSTVLFAWLTLIVAIFYVGWQEYMYYFNNPSKSSNWIRRSHPPHHSQHHQSHYHQRILSTNNHNNISSKSEGTATVTPMGRWTRNGSSSTSPGMDDVLALWHYWYQDQPKSLQALVTGGLTGSVESTPMTTTIRTSRASNIISSTMMNTGPGHADSITPTTPPMMTTTATTTTLLSSSPSLPLSPDGGPSSSPHRLIPTNHPVRRRKKK